MSASHRAEVRAKVHEILSLYGKTRENFSEAQSDRIMALLDSERERWTSEVKQQLPARKVLADKYPSGFDKGFNVALDAVSKVLDDTASGNITK